MAERLPAVCLDHDAVFYTRTWSRPTPMTRELLDRLRRVGIATIGYHLDLLWGLNREPVIRTDPMFRCEYVFTADGDHDREWAKAGVEHHWLRAGVHEPECYDATPDPAQWGEYDVAFVGSWAAYHDEWPHRQQLVSHLRDWYGDRLLLLPRPRKSAVRGDALNRVYATVPVVVGDSILQRAHRSRYWSDRVYETWGRGGFLVFPQVDALEAEIGAYPSWTLGKWHDLRDTIDGYLADPDARAAARERIAQTVRSSCTYRDRMTSLLRTAELD